MRTAIIPVSLYGADVIVVAGGKPAEIHAFVDRACRTLARRRKIKYNPLAWHDLQEAEFYAKRQGCCRDADAVQLIWVEHEDRSPRAMSVLAHEAAHAAGNILRRVGVQASFKNDEPFTYLLSAIVGGALEQMQHNTQRATKRK